jgi:hypothetical protein
LSEKSYCLKTSIFAAGSTYPSVFLTEPQGVYFISYETIQKYRMENILKEEKCALSYS